MRALFLLGGAVALSALPLPSPSRWLCERERIRPRWLAAVYVVQQWSDPARWEEVRTEVLRHVGTVRASLHPGWSASRRLRALTVYLRGLFREYREDQSRVDRVLEVGQFNCVSASLLVWTFAQALNLPARVLHRPGHVFCVVDLPPGSGVTVDFALGLEGQDGQELSTSALVGLVAQNLFLEALSEGDLERGIRLAVDREALEARPEGRQAFAASILHVLIALEGRARRSEARSLARAVRDRYGSHPVWDRALSALNAY